MAKKLFSAFLAVLMICSIAPFALAAPIPTPDDAVVGEGETIYLDTEIYDIVYPTSAAFDFLLDPMGLSEIAKGESAKLEDLDGGSIVGSAPQPFINFSSVPVKITAAVKGTTTAGADAENKPLATATFVTTEAAANTGTDNNVLLYVAPAGSEMPSRDSAFAAAKQGFVLSTDAIDLEFALPAAAYNVTNNNDVYEAVIIDDTIGHGSALQVGGFVNKNADWTVFTEGGADTPSKVGIEITFTPAKDTDAATYTDDSYDAASGAFALLTSTVTDRIPITPATPAVAFPETFKVTSASEDAVITFDGSLAENATLATNYLQVYWGGKWVSFVGSGYTTYATISASTVTIKALTLGDATKGLAAAPLNIKVKDTNGVEYACTISLAS